MVSIPPDRPSPHKDQRTKRFQVPIQVMTALRLLHVAIGPDTDLKRNMQHHSERTSVVSPLELYAERPSRGLKLPVVAFDAATTPDALQALKLEHRNEADSNCRFHKGFLTPQTARHSSNHPHIRQIDSVHQQIALCGRR